MFKFLTYNGFKFPINRLIVFIKLVICCLYNIHITYIIGYNIYIYIYKVLKYDDH